MSAKHTYSNLDTSRREIRLLFLDPGPRGQSDILKCNLQTTVLPQQRAHQKSERYGSNATVPSWGLDPLSYPRCHELSSSYRPQDGTQEGHEAQGQYETISYVWGDGSLRSNICLDGSIVRVPSSSEKALRRMRLEDKVRVLWIDALCINQADPVEKSHQVAIMSEIYRHGKQNLIYLGEDDKHIESALQSVRRLMNTEIADVTRGGKSLNSTLLERDKIPRLADNGFTVEVDQEALEKLFSNPWFSRLWVVQEAVCASGNRFYAGNYDFDLFEICVVVKWLSHKLLYLSSSLCGSEGFRCAMNLFRHLGTEHFGSSSVRSSAPLIDLLAAARQRTSSDPRDKVFGILGLIDWAPRGGVPAELLPDYTASVSDVFAQATLYSMKELSSLLPFEYIFHRSRDDIHFHGMPSWVPRWHRSHNKWDGNSVFGLEFRASYGLPWNASLTMAPTGKNKYHKCQVEGILMDVVEHVSCSSNRSDFAGFREGGIELLRSVIANRDDRYTVEAYVLTTEVWSDKRPLTTSQLEACKKFIHILVAGDKLPPLPGTLPANASVEEVELAGSHLAVTIGCSQRSTCRTRRRLPSLVPGITEPGDVLVILFGADIPYVLRPCDENYELIGQAYVYGMMRGEAVTEWQRKGRPTEKFTLI